MPLKHDTRAGKLEITGASASWISMHGPAWTMLPSGLARLYIQTELKGENLDLPNLPGRRAYAHELDQYQDSLPMYIAGDVDQDGDPHSDVWEGAELNLAYLYNELKVIPATEAGTRAARITKPSGAIVTADIQILDVRLGAMAGGVDPLGPVWNATLEILIPGGRFS